MSRSQPGCAGSGAARPQRCSALPASARTRSVAVWSRAAGLSQALTIARTSVPSGTLTLPGGPAGFTGPVKMAGPAGSVTVPPGADVRELVKEWDVAPARDHTAVLRVRENAAFGLRRWARRITPDSDGWDRVTVSFADVPWYADYLASFGQDVVVLEPPDLREAVINRLKGVLT